MFPIKGIRIGDFIRSLHKRIGTAFSMLKTNYLLVINIRH